MKRQTRRGSGIVFLVLLLGVTSLRLHAGSDPPRNTCKIIPCITVSLESCGHSRCPSANITLLLSSFPYRLKPASGNWFNTSQPISFCLDTEQKTSGRWDINFTMRCSNGTVGRA